MIVSGKSILLGSFDANLPSPCFNNCITESLFRGRGDGVNVVGCYVMMM